MEKEFIPYEQAFELAKLNFNGKCFGYYDLESEVHIEISCNLDTNLTRRNFFAAPTFSQAFRWFREKYQIDNWIYPNLNGLYSVLIVRRGVGLGKVSEYQTYEAAELACLKKLIEIVK